MRALWEKRKQMKNEKKHEAGRQRSLDNFSDFAQPVMYTRFVIPETALTLPFTTSGQNPIWCRNIVFGRETRKHFTDLGLLPLPWLARLFRPSNNKQTITNRFGKNTSSWPNPRYINQNDGLVLYYFTSTKIGIKNFQQDRIESRRNLINYNWLSL